MKLKNFDPLDYLQNEEDYREALIAAHEEDPGDGSLIASTLGDIAKAREITQLAKDTGLSREFLYGSLKDMSQDDSLSAECLSSSVVSEMNDLYADKTTKSN